MKKGLTWLLVLCMVFATTPLMAETTQDAAQEDDYVGNMKYDLTRGLKNLATFPLELFITIQEYHEDETKGRPVIRHFKGFVDGTFQGLCRGGSGAWDLIAAFLPGHQEGMPVDPETLF